MPPHRFSADGCNKLLTVDLPLLESLKGVDLDMSSTAVRLLLPGSAEYVEIPLPLEISGNKTSATAPTAKFSRKRGQLTLTWDADSCGQMDVVETSREPARAVVAETPAVAPPTEREANSLAGEKWLVKDGRVCLIKDSAKEKGQLPTKDSHNLKETRCIGVLQSEVEHALKQCTVEKLRKVGKLGGTSMLLDNFLIEGEAICTKFVCTFNASVSFTWEALDPFGGFLGVSGSGHAAAIASTEQSPKVVVRVSPCGGAQARAAGEWMKQHGACLISECLKGEILAAAVLSAKLLESVDSDSDSDAAEMKAVAKNVPQLLQERSMTKWAEAWVIQKLENLSVSLFGGLACATFSSPRVSGNASISPADGKLTTLFNLRVECDWVVTSSTKGVGEMRGTLLVAELTSEKGAKAAALEVEATPGKKTSGQLLTAFRRDGVSAVRAVMDEFVSELQLQIECPSSAT